MTEPVVVHEFGPPGAPTIVLLHGLTESGLTWPDAVERWRDRWRLIAVDLRGHGESPRFGAAELAHAQDVHVADAIAILEAAGAGAGSEHGGGRGPGNGAGSAATGGAGGGQAALYGHSLGGLVALQVAVARPDLVRALVIEDPPRPGIGPPPGPDFVAQQHRFLDLMAQPGPEIERMRRESGWSDPEIAGWAASKSQVDRGYIDAGVPLGEARWVDLIESVTVPTLLVVPGDSPYRGLDAMLINPNVRLVEIADAGHCIRRDKPGRFHAAVDPFLADRLDLRRAGRNVAEPDAPDQFAASVEE